MIRIESLAYVVAECRQPEQWRHFGEQVVGLQARSAGSGLHLKMDERDFRIAVVSGPQDRYLASGWEVADEAAFNLALRTLAHHGIGVEHGNAELCEARRMQQLVTFCDPCGNRHELGWGHRSAFERFVSPAGVPHFVTGDLGMGHTVLPAPDFDATWSFYRDVLGFGLSDLYRHRAAGSGQVQRIHFAHCANGRHHSLALFEGTIPAGCVHLMVEVPSMDEVGRAHDRMQKHGARQMATLGRHVNDLMTSFYVATPSGFALEIGYGGLVLGWSGHRVFETTSVSLWGHDFSVGFR